MIKGRGETCCGCTACLSICKKNAITMQENYKGFQEPLIDEIKCINCGLCDTVCPLKIENKTINNNKYYAAKRKNAKKRAMSQSGGAFAALAEFIIKQGGVVYGVKLDKALKAVYVRVNRLSAIKCITGSKYVQASVGNCFSLLLEDLRKGKRVLFSGTPCHVHGLKEFLSSIKADSSKLITVDLVCHGTPSPRIYQEYLDLLAEQHRHKVTGFDFRAKRFGWHGHTVVVAVGLKQYKNNDYTRFFYSSYALRDSCYNCRYANLNRIGDLTLGDCWGIEKTYPEFDDNRGISLVIVNTKRGNVLWNSVSHEFEMLEMTKDQILQPNLEKPTEAPADIEMFWKDYKKFGCEYSLYRYCGFDPNEEQELIEGHCYLRRAVRKLHRLYNRVFY